MKKKQLIPVLLTALLLSLESNFNLLQAAPVASPIDDATLDLIDPLDTLDEVDLQAMRDTIPMSRKNLARGTNAVNMLDYTVRDYYSPHNDLFVKGFSENLYLGANFGFEEVYPSVDDASPVTMIQVMGQIGTRLNTTNNIRLTLGGGWGYQYDDAIRVLRVSGRFDWIHSLSNHFYGYRTNRPLELSTILGLGGHYTLLRQSYGRKLSPEIHAGLQFKIFAGPNGFLNIEPYVGMGGPTMDRLYVKNWRNFDLFWGVNAIYEYSMRDPLSKAQRMKYLLKRLEKHPDEEYDKSDFWRKPWFFEASAGIALGYSDKIDFGKTLGHTTSLSVGKWISPVMGFRGTAFTRITQRDEFEVDERCTFGPSVLRYNQHYMGLRAEALLNPMGFISGSSWDDQFGVFLSAGASLGTLTKYKDNFKTKYRRGSEAYTIALHGFTRVTNDLQLFIEPRYEHNVYVEDNHFGGINSFTMNMGFTMMLRTNKYRLREEMDEIQAYTHKNNYGFHIGLGGGFAMLSRRYKDYENGGFEWNAQTWVDYLFNYLHGVRVNLDLMNTSHQEDWAGIIDRKIIFGSVDYDLNITNLCSGRILNRKFDFEAFVGPAIMYCLDLKTEYGNLQDTKKYHFGVNGGVKLSFPIGKTGLAAYFNPQVYFIQFPDEKSLLGANTISIYKRLHLFQSVNLGIQYKVGSLHRDRTFLKELHNKQDKSWRSRQARAMEKYQQKYAKKVAKRHK